MNKKLFMNKCEKIVGNQIIYQFCLKICILGYQLYKYVYYVFFGKAREFIDSLVVFIDFLRLTLIINNVYVFRVSRMI